MVSREHRRTAMHEKLQALRSLTNSHALRKSSIILDASKYIRELKEKVGRLNHEIIATAQNSPSVDKNLSIPEVSIETLEKGFVINVFSEKSCPGLLASVLEVFEGLGLNVVEAKASCIDAFRLVAVGRHAESTDEQVVKEAVRHAIKSFFRGSEE
ncbi:hypothetical protein Cni_G25108 [Canna indica]|uniref:Plant bHLH transcription factor ACT-like domain-containing protein n=1 Tax=Canna indica TaxID=4628 RepID=A0AAQ3QP56_9LILI|nr:hypothetical protein Cni_G25108 [Canna indica]